VTLAVLVPLFLTYRQTVPMALLALPVSAVLAALIARLTGWSERSPDIAYGVLYLGLPGVALLWLREGVDGRGWALLLFAVTWSADVVAYAAGNVLKGPKLWPRFSPNKTWSGFCFGLAGSVAAALAASMIWAPEGGPGLRWAAAIGFTAGLATMAGDLWESMLKRRFGVKDSGDLIPGHGGLLDRVDGLMFAVLVVSAARLAIAASNHSQAVTQFR
jgi:phosphatidate cytidylyltransferase